MRVGPFGAPELIIILLIIVVLFGASRLAGIGGAIGQSIREFRKASKDPEEEERKRREAELASARTEERPTFVASVPAPPTTNGATTIEHRPSDTAPAPTPAPSATTSRPPDFTGG